MFGVAKIGTVCESVAGAEGEERDVGRDVRCRWGGRSGKAGVKSIDYVADAAVAGEEDDGLGFAAEGGGVDG